MKDESRDKKKIFEIIPRYGLIFALIGCIIVVIAIFMPIFHLYEDNIWLVEYEYHNLWIYGLYEYGFGGSSPYHIIEWFGTVEANKLGFAAVSITSTVVIGLSVLGTVFTAGYTLVRKRKKGVYSSRVALYCSMGVFGALHFFGWLMPFYQLGIGRPKFYLIGPLLFIIGSFLILIGYKVKIIPLLKIASIFLASSLIFAGVMELLVFFYNLTTVPPIYLDNFVAHSIYRIIIPAAIAILCALAIVIVNIILHRRAKRKTGII